MKNFAISFICLTLFSGLFAQDAALETPPLVTPEVIEARIKIIDANGLEISEEDRAKAIFAYQDALTSANKRKASVSEAAAFTRQIGEAPRLLEKLSTQDTSLEDDELVPATPDELTLDELNKRNEAIKERLATEREIVQNRITEEQRRAKRLDLIPDYIEKRKASIAELPEENPSPSSEVEQAENYRIQAKRELLRQQILTYETELKYYAATAESLTANASVSARRTTELSKASDAWQKIINKRRQSVTSAAAKKARSDLETFKDNPEAAEIAQENAGLAERHGGPEGLSRRMAIASRNLAEFETLNERATMQHAAAQRRVKLLEDANLRIDPTTSQLLRQQRQLLRPQKELREELRDTLQDSAQAQIDLLLLEDRQTEVMAKAPTAVQDPELTQLSETRGTLLKSLVDDYRAYIATLSNTSSTLRSLTRETSAFALFVDQRLLWMPSTHPIKLSEPQMEAKSVYELFAADPFKALREDIIDTPFIWGLVALVTIILFSRRKTYLSRLAALGTEARKRNCTSYTPTVKALGYTCLIVTPVSFLVWFIYMRSGDLNSGVAEGIRNTAGFLTFTLLFLRIAHPQGLLVDHFRLSDKRVSILRNNLRWFIPLMLPLIFFTTTLPKEATASSAGRLFFIGTLVGLLIFFHRTLRPAKHLIHWRGKAPNRLANVCYFVSLAAPAGLIIGAAAGYYVSVSELRVQALMTVWLILFTLFIAAMLYRWILVSRRRFAVQQALKRRAAALAERSAEKADPSIKPQDIASSDEVKAEAVKIVVVEEQTARLVRAAAITFILFAVWGIWRPTIPALTALDKVLLWEDTSVKVVEEPATKTESKSLVKNPITDVVTATPTKIVEAISADGRVTLQDLVASLITLLLTFVAANNIPGLLELSIFRRLRLQPGSSFALTTSVRYIIVVVGIVIALGLLEITWGKVQWIAAAITLGIGFGLQEIFANFVAGLIILFERPVRLGDVVTVGDVSGRVTQIRIRATTIRQFNNRELIVPNKEFITGQLVNWTLSDSILRFEIPVGIAYGSDTGLARELLLKAAQNHPKVIKEPAADVIFDNFGASALNFQLRAHVASVDDLVHVKNDLHFTIDDSFREAGIEIAFPQTDLHIRTLPESAPKVQI